MENTIDQVIIDYKFLDQPNIGGDSVLIENNLTVIDFKNLIQGRYKFIMTEYLFIYDSKERKDMEVLSSFLSKHEEKEVIFIKKYTSLTQGDFVQIDYKFQDRPSVGGDSVLIENNLTVIDFKNLIQGRYKFIMTEYLFIYDSKERKDMEVLSSFLSKHEEKEVIFIKKYNSGF